MSSGVAEIEITASTGRLPAALRQATNMVKGFAGAAAGAVGSVGKAMLDVGKRAAGHFIGNLATRGLDLLVEQGHNVLKFEEALMRLGLASRKSGAELRQIGNDARALSTSTGIDAVEVLRGARAYVDLAGAEQYTAEKMSLIARTAQASGADIGDVSSVVFALGSGLKVTGAELENTIGGLLNQSKSGAIHFNQMAQEFTALAPVYAQFGVTGRVGAIRLGAALQVVRTGFGSASEAATGLQRLMRSLPQHAPKFAKWGVEIYRPGSKTKLLELDQIMANIYKSKLRLDRTALIKAFGRGEGERAFQLFLGDSVDLYHRLIEAGMINGTIQADAATVAASASGRIAMATEKMKNAVAVAFSPERVAAFADALTRAATAVMDAAVWFDKHVDVSTTDSKKMASDYAYDEIKGNGMSLDEYRKLAIDLQNYKEGDDLPHQTMVALRRHDSLTGGKIDAGVARDVGERMAREITAGGAGNAVSAGMMVHQDESIAAGEAYLRRLGWTPPRFGAGEGPSVSTGGEGGAYVGQEAIVADAVRKALEPALRDIARALGQRPATVVSVDGNPIARAADNASDRRTRP